MIPMMRRSIATAFAFAFVVSAAAAEPQRIPLWENGAPGTPATKPENEPVLFAYRAEPQNAARSAVVVCPGGGYVHLAMDHEGKQIAEWFNKLGVTAFVLQYRNNSSGHRHPVPMMDGQRAIRTVRSRAAEWNLDPAKIGVMGFSAGGHLASTLATHFDGGNADAADAIDRASSRPDFLILCYPVISMTESYMHRGSRENLLGKEADESLAANLSNEQQVTAQTPPTFIFQTDADKGRARGKLRGVLPRIAPGRRPGRVAHLPGREARRRTSADVPATSTWPDRLRDWMQFAELSYHAESRIELRTSQTDRDRRLARTSARPAPNKISRPGASVHRRRLIMRESIHAVRPANESPALCDWTLNTAPTAAGYPAENRAGRAPCNTDRPSGPRADRD